MFCILRKSIADIAQLVDMLSPHGTSRSAINDKMNGNDLLNPESMIVRNSALQQYSTFINYESSRSMTYDMLSGIIAKIWKLLATMFDGCRWKSYVCGR